MINVAISECYGSWERLSLKLLYKYNKEIWISPKKGWIFRKGDKIISKILEVDEAWKVDRYFKYLILRNGNKRPTKHDIVTTRCYDIRISDDGRFIYYKNPGLMSNETSWEYSVEYGVSRRLKRNPKGATLNN